MAIFLFRHRRALVSLWFRELDEHWLVADIFHARRDPDWIQPNS